MKVYAGIDNERRIILVQFRLEDGHFDSREWQHRLPHASEDWKQSRKRYTRIEIDDMTGDPTKYLGHKLKEFSHGRLRASTNKYTNASASVVKEIDV